MVTETELKLLIPHGALAALRRHPRWQGCALQGRTVTLDNIYYDTPDCLLQRARIGLRTRRMGRTWLQTVKVEGESVAGLSQRPEWESAWQEGEFDFSAINDARVARVLNRARLRLAAVSQTRFRRQTRLYQPNENVSIALMLDVGTMHGGGREAPLCELELELERGTVADLFALASELASDLPLMPCDASKAERAFRLSQSDQQRAVLAEDLPLDSNARPPAAFVTLALACVRQWQENAILARDDAIRADCLLQLRLSQRRLRTLLKLFAPVLPAAFLLRWRGAFAKNAALFAHSRDLDALCQRLLPAVKPLSEEERVQYEGLCQYAERERTKVLSAAARSGKGKNAAHALDLQGVLILEFVAALQQLPPAGTLVDAVDLKRFAKMRLEYKANKIRKIFRASHFDEQEHLKLLRLALKDLRYGLAFFASLLPARASARAGRTLVQAQDALEFACDVNVARACFQQWQAAAPQLAVPAAYVNGWHARRYDKMRRRAWRRIKTLLWDDKPW